MPATSSVPILAMPLTIATVNLNEPDLNNPLVQCRLMCGLAPYPYIVPAVTLINRAALIEFNARYQVAAATHRTDETADDMVLHTMSENEDNELGHAEVADSDSIALSLNAEDFLNLQNVPEASVTEAYSFDITVFEAAGISVERDSVPRVASRTKKRLQSSILSSGCYPQATDTIDFQEVQMLRNLIEARVQAVVAAQAEASDRKGLLTTLASKDAPRLTTEVLICLLPPIYYPPRGPYPTLYRNARHSASASACVLCGKWIKSDERYRWNIHMKGIGCKGIVLLGDEGVRTWRETYAERPGVAKQFSEF
ncbi:hypothetical protein BKA62DRAFT_672444 [Auriculariales sp. MPI-PUGE-AT-0066]|nr:hypothetical protein BKA62DRAFT_672444 [Auriculariales sp. MPI-PUGE-AT-0066]